MATVAPLDYVPRDHEVGFGKLLVAEDFSPLADVALDYALELAAKHQCEFRVVYALGDGAGISPVGDDGTPAEESLGQRLEDVAKRCKKVVETAECVVRKGSVHDVLMNEVETWKPDVVLLGAYGHDLSERDRLGSTAESFLRALPCAVVTIGPNVVARSDQSKHMPVIVCPMDLPDGAHDHLRMIARVAKTLGAKVSLVHAVDVHDPFHRPSHADMQFQCGRLVTELLREGVLAESTLLYGLPEEQIAEHAQENHACYILFGLHKYGNFSSYFHKSLVARVIKSAPCGIMTFPAVASHEHSMCHPVTSYPASEREVLAGDTPTDSPIEADDFGSSHRSGH